MLVAARTHDYGKQPIDSLAGLLKSEGIDAAQLVLPKGFTEIGSYDEVTPEIIERIRANFEKEGIKIHILGCYMDLGNPDDDVRKQAVDTFKKCLAFNKTLGASIVGSETAYPRLNDEEKKIWHPYMMDSIARLVEEAAAVYAAAYYEAHLIQESGGQEGGVDMASANYGETVN